MPVLKTIALLLAFSCLVLVASQNLTNYVRNAEGKSVAWLAVVVVV